MEKPIEFIDTAAVVDTAKSSKDAPKFDSWKKEYRKYKTRRGNLVKTLASKITGRCIGLSGFIYDLVPNQTGEYIQTTLDIEEYEGKTYRKKVRKKRLIGWTAN